MTSHGETNEGGEKYDVPEVLRPRWPDLGSSLPPFLTASLPWLRKCPRCQRSQTCVEAHLRARALTKKTSVQRFSRREKRRVTACSSEDRLFIVRKEKSGASPDEQKKGERRVPRKGAGEGKRPHGRLKPDSLHRRQASCSRGGAGRRPLQCAAYKDYGGSRCGRRERTQALEARQ